MLRFRVFSDVCPWYTRRRSNFFLGIVWSLGILTCILALACCFQPYTRAWPDLCDVTDLVMVVTMVMQASADLVLTVSMVTVVQKIRQSVLDAKRRQRHPPKKARSWRGKRASVASLRSMVVAAVVTPLRTAVRLSTDTSRNDGTATSPGGQPTRSVTGAMPLAEDDDSQIVTAGGLSISLESESARNSYMAPTSVISSQIGQQKQPGRNSALSSINSSPHLQGSSQRESRSTTSNDHHQHLTAPSMDGDEQKASASIAASFHRIMIRLVVVIVIMSVAITADASIYLSVPGVLGDTISDTTTRLYMAGMIAGWTLLLALVRARDA
ncbi:hypothetical protein BC828DRAFT_406326 [Blastocladiella britannica]|nr:hypothetical protein BC828DRAFT_406326 [Blastocladiella britannica]